MSSQSFLVNRMNSMNCVRVCEYVVAYQHLCSCETIYRVVWSTYSPIRPIHKSNDWLFTICSQHSSSYSVLFWLTVAYTINKAGSGVEIPNRLQFKITLSTLLANPGHRAQGRRRLAQWQISNHNTIDSPSDMYLFSSLSSRIFFSNKKYGNWVALA